MQLLEDLRSWARTTRRRRLDPSGQAPVVELSDDELAGVAGGQPVERAREANICGRTPGDH